jgi:tRNA uridine 5-carboxymethylaminomethyl modification enzyme
LALKTSKLLKSVSAEELLRRPEVGWSSLSKLGFTTNFDPFVHEAVEIDVKYSGYIRRQCEIINQSKGMESLKLPESLDYSLIRGLSSEEIQKLSLVRPRTLGQAQRISGVNPSAIHAIMIYLKSKTT